ncbi:MAG TPA: diphosphate--fructose-6-phosphate 1-phosphotransferase, partial [Parachlamydiaceae bacterium]|nr:diphosphate--fructose-6-phosphate 1-phosphotransferase [Parachlamydiaceae bacterium]
MQESLMQVLRREEKPELPKILSHIKELDIREETAHHKLSNVAHFFPLTGNQKTVRFIKGKEKIHQPKRVGVFFSGGQAAGGHNVVIGLFNALKTLNPKSQLFGFLGGSDGLLKNEWIELKENILSYYLNQGGFDLLGSSRTKIEDSNQFQQTAATVKEL